MKHGASCCRHARGRAHVTSCRRRHRLRGGRPRGRALVPVFFGTRVCSGLQGTAAGNREVRGAGRGRVGPRPEGGGARPGSPGGHGGLAWAGPSGSVGACGSGSRRKSPLGSLRRGRGRGPRAREGAAWWVESAARATPTVRGRPAQPGRRIRKTRAQRQRLPDAGTKASFSVGSSSVLLCSRSSIAFLDSLAFNIKEAH